MAALSSERIFIDKFKIHIKEGAMALAGASCFKHVIIAQNNSLMACSQFFAPLHQVIVILSLGDSVFPSAVVRILYSFVVLASFPLQVVPP